MERSPHLEMVNDLLSFMNCTSNRTKISEIESFYASLHRPGSLIVWGDFRTWKGRFPSVLGKRDLGQ